METTGGMEGRRADEEGYAILRDTAAVAAITRMAFGATADTVLLRIEVGPMPAAEGGNASPISATRRHRGPISRRCGLQRAQAAAHNAATAARRWMPPVRYAI
ncbi:MAG: hypothetical protein ACLFU0_08325 [Alphaproteobacteria bacterium]